MSGFVKQKLLTKIGYSCTYNVKFIFKNLFWSPRVFEKDRTRKVKKKRQIEKFFVCLFRHKGN